MEHSVEGRLLVATPGLLDPNFFRTVVLMLQHDAEGTVGIILNRLTPARVEDHLPGWEDRAAPPGTIMLGGPVEPEVAIGVTVGASGMSAGVPGLSLVDLGSPPEESAGIVRIYSGYAGWSAGQLEAEIAEGAWYVVPASPDDPFEDPETQWRRVLRRQTGWLAVVSTFPDDIGLN